VFILEPFVDLQDHGTALALTSVSLYFACMANGRGKMHRQSEMEGLVEDAGLRVSRLHQGMGMFNYTLMECVGDGI
jgi:hypothetical protein